MLCDILTQQLFFISVDKVMLCIDDTNSKTVDKRQCLSTYYFFFN